MWKDRVRQLATGAGAANIIVFLFLTAVAILTNSGSPIRDSVVIQGAFRATVPTALLASVAYAISILAREGLGAKTWAFFVSFYWFGYFFIAINLINRF